MMQKQRTNRVLICILVIGSLLFASGCGKEVTEEDDRLVVAVSIMPQETFVKAVCGDLVDVITMIPPGFSPETYEPTPQMMQELQNASIYFALGVPSETYIMPSVDEVTVVALDEVVAQAYPELTMVGHSHEEDAHEEERDPHIWLSPKRVMLMVEEIADQMSLLDPEHEETYRANAEEYLAQLEEVDQEIKDILSTVQNPKFIVFHPAFGYLADDYGLTMYSLEQDGKEATAQHIQEMIDLAIAEEIKVIFYQAEIDSSQSEAFAEEIGGVTTQLAPLAADYIQNLKNMAETMAEGMR